jgi:peptidoglycan/LPS O-acetylase OafA/YrhL
VAAFMALHEIRKRIEVLQATRGVAAWFVVTGHINTTALIISGQHPLFVAAQPYLGLVCHFGVDVFFVISGAIMWILYGDRHAPTGWSAAGTFLRRRALRIYPLFWITALPLIPLLSNAAPAGIMDLGLQALLMREPSFHPVAWTLAYEMHFYAVVLLEVLCSRGRPQTGLAVAGLLMLALIVVLPDRIPFLSEPMTSEFVLGLAVGALYRRGGIDGRAVFAAGLVALPFGFWTLLGRDVDTLLAMRAWAFGVPAALLLLGLLLLERARAIRVPRLLQMAGDRSYSVYLWHLTIVLFPFSFVPFTGVLGGVCFYAGVVAATVIVSEVSFRLIERPLGRLARRPRRSSVAMAPAA